VLLSRSPNTGTVFGQSMTYTATVAATSPSTAVPQGTVKFQDGGVDIGTCTAQAVSSSAATCTVSTLGVGTHQITAIYIADASFNVSPASNTISQVVSKASTSVALASSLNPSLSGQSVTFTATLSVIGPGSGSPTGSLTFKDGGVNIGTCSAQTVSSSVATCTIASLGLGTHSITAVYNGDSSFNASPASNTVSQVVN
jgi:hypothetical protein